MSSPVLCACQCEECNPKLWYQAWPKRLVTCTEDEHHNIKESAANQVALLRLSDSHSWMWNEDQTLKVKPDHCENDPCHVCAEYWMRLAVYEARLLWGDVPADLLNAVYCGRTMYGWIVHLKDKYARDFE